MRKWWIVPSVMILIHSSVFSQNTYYVSTHGNDSNNGSFQQPWRTINHGVSQLYPGDTLKIREGTYNEIVYNFMNSGNSDGIITIKNYNDEHVVIDGNGR